MIPLALGLIGKVAAAAVLPRVVTAVCDLVRGAENHRDSVRERCTDETSNRNNPVNWIDPSGLDNISYHQALKQSALGVIARVQGYSDVSSLISGLRPEQLPVANLGTRGSVHVTARTTPLTKIALSENLFDVSQVPAQFASSANFYLSVYLAAVFVHESVHWYIMAPNSIAEETKCYNREVTFLKGLLLKGGLSPEELRVTDYILADVIKARIAVTGR